MFHQNILKVKVFNEISMKPAEIAIIFMIIRFVVNNIVQNDSKNIISIVLQISPSTGLRNTCSRSVFIGTQI